MARILSVGPPVLGIALAWIFFFLIGRGLLLLPTSVPDGTVGDTRPEARR